MLCLKDGDKGGLKIKCWKDCKRADIEQVLFARGLLSPADVTYYTPTPVNNDEDEDDRRLRKIEWLLKLTPQLCPISNTLAEHYLLHERHLPQLPPCDALGYWGAGFISALVGLARDKDGDLVAAQVVYLDRNGCKLRKQTRGFPKLKSVRLPSRSGGRNIIIIAEGLESALSIWAAVNFEVEVWSVGGKDFLKYASPRTRPRGWFSLPTMMMTPRMVAQRAARSTRTPLA